MRAPKALYQSADSAATARLAGGARPEVTVRRAPGRWPGLGLGELWRFREVCVVLAKRNLKVRYRQTLLGAAWAIIQPLTLMIAMTIFFGIIGRMPRQGDLPFPVFFLPAIVIWHASSRLLAQATVSVVQNKALIEKVYFPRAYFPFAATLVAAVDLFFGLLALAGILVIYQVIPSWTLLTSFIFFAIAFATMLGVGLWLSALNARYRDVGQFQPFLSQVWFYASPVIYPAAFVPEPYYIWYFLNPIAFAITGFRWAVSAEYPPPPPEAWLISPLVALGLLVSGYIAFRLREPTLDDVL